MRQKANEQDSSEMSEETTQENEYNPRKNETIYRNTLSSFYKFIKKIMKCLKPTHINFLKTTPFWEFINLFLTEELQLSDIKWSFKCLDKVLKTYNPELENFEINGGFHLKLNYKHVAKMFGIPSEGITVKELQPKEKKCLPLQCKKFIDKYLHENETLTKTVIEREIVKILKKRDKQSCEDVVRFIIMHLMCSFFFSNSKSNLKWSFLPYVHDFDKMKRVNWSKAILFDLQKHMKNCAENRRKNHSCVTILLYWICDCLPVMDKRGTYQEGMPTMAKWRLTRLKKLLTSEFLSTVDEQMVNVEEREHQNSLSNSKGDKSCQFQDLESNYIELKIYVKDLEKQIMALRNDVENLKKKLDGNQFSTVTEDHLISSQREKVSKSVNDKSDSENHGLKGSQDKSMNESISKKTEKDYLRQNEATEREKSEEGFESEEHTLENTAMVTERNELPSIAYEETIDPQKKELLQFENACLTYIQSFIVYKNTDENIIIASFMLQNYLSRKKVDEQILNWYITNMARKKNEQNLYFKSDEVASLTIKAKNNEFIQKHLREKLLSDRKPIQILFFPIKHLNNHWTLLVYYIEKEEWYHYNCVKARPNNYAETANTIKDNALISVNEVLKEKGINTKRKKMMLIQDTETTRSSPDIETSALDVMLFMKVCSLKHYLTTSEDLKECREYYSYLILSDSKYGWERSTTKFI